MSTKMKKRLAPLERFERNLRRIAFSKVTRNAERPILLTVADAAKKATRK